MNLKHIARPTNLLGLKIYSGHFVRAASEPEDREVIPFPDHYPQSTLNRLKFAPQSIYWTMRHCHELYSPKGFYLTENGASYDEPNTSPQDGLNDLYRREFLRNNLLHAHRTVDEGLPCCGYIPLSFLDNFG